MQFLPCHCQLCFIFFSFFCTQTQAGSLSTASFSGGDLVRCAVFEEIEVRYSECHITCLFLAIFCYFALFFFNWYTHLFFECKILLFSPSQLRHVSQHFDECLSQYIQFMEMVPKYKGETLIPSPIIDLMWHTHMMFPQQVCFFVYPRFLCYLCFLLWLNFSLSFLSPFLSLLQFLYDCNTVCDGVLEHVPSMPASPEQLQRMQELWMQAYGESLQYYP